MEVLQEYLVFVLILIEEKYFGKALL